MYKELYDLLEKSDEGKAHLEKLKGFSTKLGDAEAKVRKLETEFKAFEGVDIAKLRADAELIEKNGGAEKVLALVAKANGYDADIERTKKEAEEYKTLMQTYQSEAEQRAKENQLLSIKADVQPFFVKNFKSGIAEVLLKEELNSGGIVMTETGIAVKNGDKFLPFETGQEIIKAKYAEVLITPPAGDGQGGVNRGNNGNNGERTLSMAEKIAAKHKA